MEDKDGREVRPAVPLWLLSGVLLVVLPPAIALLFCMACSICLEIVGDVSRNRVRTAIVLVGIARDIR
jgi:hypothetical protein